MAQKKRTNNPKAVKHHSKKHHNKNVKTASQNTCDLKTELRQEIANETKDLFYPPKWTFSIWAKRYSPVIITMLVGLATYFYLVFFMFYPVTIQQGHYIQLLLVLMVIFIVAGLLIYLGLKAELLAVRLTSFIFVFVVFTFLILFILLANNLRNGLIN